MEESLKPSNPTALISGCGYIGKAVGIRLQALGFQVFAVTRNPVTAEDLRKTGFEVFEGQLDKPDWRTWAPMRCDWVFHTVSSAAPNPEGYRQSYLQGTQQLLQWASTLKGDPPSAVYTGSTSVYPQKDGSVVDETSVTGGSEAATILLEAEKLFLAGPWNKAYVFRLAGIYGPGRHRLLDQLLQGESLFPSGDAFLNLIYRDDAADLFAHIATQSPQDLPPSDVFNLSDGNPHPKRDMLRWLAEKLKLPEPMFKSSSEATESVRPTGRGANRRISIERLKSTWKWCPAKANFKQGFATILEGQSALINRNDLPSADP